MEHSRTIYDLIDSVRARPALYLGNLHKESFGALIAFLTGLRCGGIPDGEPPFRLFPSWVGFQPGYDRTSLPWEWMERTWGNEGAWREYFEQLDRYRKCRMVELERAQVAEQPPRFVMTVINDSRGRRVEEREEPRPKWLEISELEPSGVFVLRSELSDLGVYPSHAVARRRGSKYWGTTDADWIPARR